MLRSRLTYANVMSTIAVFLVLGGATAFAAHQLGRHSVGARQLKANAVSTAKIKKEAVSRKKIKNSAVDTTKIADGTVAGTDINIPSTPFSRVVAKLRGNSTLAVSATLQAYPLSPSTYVQAPEEVDGYPGAMDLSFPAACTVPRSAIAYVLVDPTNPLKPELSDVVGIGETEDTVGGNLSKRIEIGPYPGTGGKFEPGVTKTHSVFLLVEGKCKTGSGITATSGAVDVIGTR
jgi:hypothetical protein